MGVIAIIHQFRRAATNGASAARWFLSIAAALMFMATPPTANAQPSAGQKAQQGSSIAKMFLSSNGKPVASSLKGWELVYVGEWVETCWEEVIYGWDHDADYYYTVCEYQWVEVPEWIWVDDCPAYGAPDTSPSLAPPPSEAFKAGRGSQGALNDKYENNPGDKLELAPNRTYQSNPGRRSAFAKLKLGSGWYSKWDRTININKGGRKAQVTRGDGSELVFMKRPNGTWQSTTDAANIILVEFPDSGRADARWGLVEPNSVETYDASGRLRRLSSRARGGGAFQLSYSADNDSGVLETVTDLRGRTLRFGYESGYVSTVTDLDGGITRFTYQDGQLIAAHYPNGQWREFQYDASGRARISPLRGPPAKSVVAGKSAGAWSAAPRVDNGPGSVGSQETSSPPNCPIPCQDWMRQEISSCTYRALIRKIDNENRFCAPFLVNLGYMTPEQIQIAMANYEVCKADVEGVYVIEVAECTSRYPQCF